MQSAFIDIGLERAAFLHVADIWHPRVAGEMPQTPHQPIEKTVFEGSDADRCRSSRIRSARKAHGLSTQVSIAGRTLVYLPQEPHIGISQKIESEAEREAVRARLTAVLPADEKGGYIVRTIAEDATGEELAGGRRVSAQDVGDDRVARSADAPDEPAVSGSESGAACAARFRQRRDDPHPDRFTRDVPDAVRVCVRIHASGVVEAAITTSASAPFLTCTASRPRSSVRCRDAST